GLCQRGGTGASVLPIVDRGAARPGPRGEIERFATATVDRAIADRPAGVRLGARARSSGTPGRPSSLRSGATSTTTQAGPPGAARRGDAPSLHSQPESAFRRDDAHTRSNKRRGNHRVHFTYNGNAEYSRASRSCRHNPPAPSLGTARGAP